MNTRSTNIVYWIITGLFAGMMIFSGITNLMNWPDAITLIVDHLGYPLYFMHFIGLAKVVGGIGLLVPGFPRLKEWAYAGFFFDLIAAIWSGYSVGDPPANWLPILVFMAALFGSYALHHRRLRTAQVSGT